MHAHVHTSCMSGWNAHVQCMMQHLILHVHLLFCTKCSRHKGVWILPVSLHWHCLQTLYILHWILWKSNIYTLFTHLDGVDAILVPSFESRFTFNTDLPPPDEWRESRRRDYPNQKYQRRAGIHEVLGMPDEFVYWVVQGALACVVHPWIFMCKCTMYSWKLSIHKYTHSACVIAVFSPGLYIVYI